MAEIDFENGRISNFQRHATLTLDRAIWHTSCIIHRPLPTHQISFESEKLFVGGCTYRQRPGQVTAILMTTKYLDNGQQSADDFVCCWDEIKCGGHLLISWPSTHQHYHHHHHHHHHHRHHLWLILLNIILLYFLIHLNFASSESRNFAAF